MNRADQTPCRAFSYPLPLRVLVLIAGLPCHCVPRPGLMVRSGVYNGGRAFLGLMQSSLALSETEWCSFYSSRAPGTGRKETYTGVRIWECSVIHFDLPGQRWPYYRVVARLANAVGCRNTGHLPPTVRSI